MNRLSTVTSSANHNAPIRLPAYFLPAVAILFGAVMLALGAGLGLAAPTEGDGVGAAITLLVGAALGAIIFVQQFRPEILSMGQALFRGVAGMGSLGRTRLAVMGLVGAALFVQGI